MKKEDFFEILGELDDDVVKGAKTPMKKKMHWKILGTIAACLCLIAVAAATTPAMYAPEENYGGGGDGGGGSIPATPNSEEIIIPTLFAPPEIIHAIKTDIADEDINSWTETDQSALDFDCVLPIYFTLNMAQSSNTILETLTFDNWYMIPALSHGECIGAFTIVRYHNKWTIHSYHHGLNLISTVNTVKDSATCFISVVQLSGEYGFLTVTDAGEKYTALPGFGASDSKSGQQLLDELKKNSHTGYNDADG